MQVDNVLIRIGSVPNTELFASQIEVDNLGFVVVNRRYETDVANVFAVGDVADPVSPTISTAVGSAASVIKSIGTFTRVDKPC